MHKHAKNTLKHKWLHSEQYANFPVTTFRREWYKALLGYQSVRGKAAQGESGRTNCQDVGARPPPLVDHAAYCLGRYSGLRHHGGPQAGVATHMNHQFTVITLPAYHSPPKHETAKRARDLYKPRIFGSSCVLFDLGCLTDVYNSAINFTLPWGRGYLFKHLTATCSTADRSPAIWQDTFRSFIFIMRCRGQINQICQQKKISLFWQLVETVK